MSKIDVKDIDLDKLDELAEDDYFHSKERVIKGQRALEELKDNGRHKKQSPRKIKSQ
jgi:hypothetical protein